MQVSYHMILMLSLLADVLFSVSPVVEWMEVGTTSRWSCN